MTIAAKSCLRPEESLRVRAVLLLSFGLALVFPVFAQGTKRLASPVEGLPWSGCTHVEGFVADEAGKFVVTTALCGGMYEAWLTRQDAESSSGSSRRGGETVDRMRIRPLEQGETLSSGPYCIAAGREVRWVAIYDWRNRKRIYGSRGGIRAAWVADLKEGRFEPAPKALIDPVVCTAIQGE